MRTDKMITFVVLNDAISYDSRLKLRCSLSLCGLGLMMILTSRLGEAEITNIDLKNESQNIVNRSKNEINV
jgi:hypothetical protein